MRVILFLCAAALNCSLFAQAWAEDKANAAPKVRQLAGVGVAGAEDLPPRFSVTFTQAEFPQFLADPAAGLEKLGYKADHVTVSVRDSVWIPKERRWGGAKILRDLPPAQSWEWLCGYEDEMCVCYPVLKMQ